MSPVDLRHSAGIHWRLSFLFYYINLTKISFTNGVHVLKHYDLKQSGEKEKTTYCSVLLDVVPVNSVLVPLFHQVYWTRHPLSFGCYDISQWYSGSNLPRSLASISTGNPEPIGVFLPTRDSATCSPTARYLLQTSRYGLDHPDRSSSSREYKCGSRFANLSANGEKTDNLPGDFVAFLCSSRLVVPKL